jgi:hypothetical protein
MASLDAVPRDGAAIDDAMVCGMPRRRISSEDSHDHVSLAFHFTLDARLFM